MSGSAHFWGWPLALFTGWRYDMVDARILRTPATAANTPTEIDRQDYAVLGTLGVIVISTTAVLLLRIIGSSELGDADMAATEVDPKSIAVLPFTNMSGDNSNEPFTLGIHDDLLTHVSKISELKVISRTSVARLDPTLNIREIGRVLGVATVLESSVQRSGNRVRINAQLIDATTDEHLWAEMFDRELSTQNIFEIQTEIAAAITEQLHATLSAQDQHNLDRRPTGNLQAYEAYMLGKQRMTLRTRDSLFDAIDYFRRATELDPQYAVAHVGLANAYLLLSNYGYLTNEESWEHAGPAIDAALAVDDQLGPAYASLGIRLVHEGEFDRAEEAFRRAIELDPNHAVAYHWFGDMLISRIGQAERAIPLLQTARELDPLSPIITVTLGQAYEMLGQYDESLDLYRKAIEIEPDYPGAYHLIGGYYHRVEGRLDEAVRWFRQEHAIDPVRETSRLGWVYMDLGDDETAKFWIDRAVRNYPNSFLPLASKMQLHRYRGEEKEAVRLARELMNVLPGNNASLVTFVTYSRFQEALREIAPLHPELACGQEPALDTTNIFHAINLSLAFEKTGDPECSAALLDAVLEQLAQMQRHGLGGYGFADAEIYARQGRRGKALKAIRAAIDDGIRRVWWLQAETSVHMASLRDDAQFQEMMSEIRVDMANQLATVRSLEADGELARIP